MTGEAAVGGVADAPDVAAAPPRHRDGNRAPAGRAAGPADEFSIAVAPVVFGDGARLFAGIDRRATGLELVDAIDSPPVTHLRYAVTAT